MTHVEAQVFGSPDWLGVLAAVLIAGPGYIAAIAAVQASRRTREVKEVTSKSAETVAEVRQTADATHAVLVEKLSEHPEMVAALQAMTEESHARQRVLEEYIAWRKSH